MKRCTFPDCGRPHYSRGLCQSHRKQQRKGETLRPVQWQNRSGRMGPCTGPDCDNTGSYGGLCWSHYHQRKAGKELAPLRRREWIGCAFDGCDRQATAKGHCATHRKQLRRGEELRPIHVPTYRYVDGNGYVRLKAPTHPNANANGLVMEHTKVMSDLLGRPLWPDEEVHHRNGVRDDNSPSNLELWTVSQPKGQRVADKLAWAREFLARYEEENPPAPS